MFFKDLIERYATPDTFAKPQKSILSALPSCRSRYRYTPLEKNQVRLLKLWPGGKRTQIHCSLHVVSLLSYNDHTAEFLGSDLKAYDAVSYVWGNGPQTEEIICDNRSLRISTNLANALDNFRDLRHASILWVDALCINQKDLSERAAQVQLMGLIYFKAHQVRIWLGLDDEPVYHANHAAILIRKFAEPYRSARRIDARSLSEQVFSQMKEIDNVNWTALHHLLAREWFQRVWVVQELGLSRDATFYCGEIQIARQELYDFLHLLEHSKLGLLISYDIDLRMLRLGQRYRNATWEGDREELGSNPQKAETFLDVLAQTRGLKCKDERDRLYAFLGHPSAFKTQRFDAGPYHSYPQNYYDSKPPIIKPNYDESVTFLRVCTDLAISAVKDRGLGLQVLAHIAHDETTINLDVPSWAPLWDIIKQSSHFYDYGRLYYASGSLKPTPLSIYTPMGSPCQSRLCLRALKLGEVQYAMIEPGTLSVQTLVETLFPERAAGSSYLKQHALDWPAAVSRVRNLTNDWSALAVTLTAGLITTDTDLVPMPAERFLSRQINGMESFLRRYERGPPQIQSSEDDDIGEYFHMDLGRAAYSRNFYYTSEGAFGLAPMITREGDEVWLPLGATMPFVLRPLSAGVFKILGQTYLHGAMKGEAVKEMSQSMVQTVLFC